MERADRGRRPSAADFSHQNRYVERRCSGQFPIDGNELRMSVFVNFALYQIGWFAVVLGAANDRPWSGMVVALVMLLVHLAVGDSIELNLGAKNLCWNANPPDGPCGGGGCESKVWV